MFIVWSECSTEKSADDAAENGGRSAAEQRPE
jgi:hypothetical protein